MEIDFAKDRLQEKKDLDVDLAKEDLEANHIETDLAGDVEGKNEKISVPKR